MYYILSFLSKLISFFPLKLLYKIGEIFTNLVFFFWYKKRKNVYNNYKIILSQKFNRPPADSEIKNIMKTNFNYYGRLNVEFLCINKIAKNINLTFKGKEFVHEALKNKNGLIIATLHMGNWDVAGVIIAHNFKPTYAIADDLGGGYSKFIQKTRGNYGINVILPNKNLKDAFLSLKNNKILNILIDRPVKNTDKTGTEITFFGKKAFVSTTAARLALKTGAKIALGYIIRDKNSFSAELSPLIKFSPTGEFNKDVNLLTQKIFNIAEKIIMRYPEQWYMFRDFWNYK